MITVKHTWLGTHCGWLGDIVSDEDVDWVVLVVVVGDEWTCVESGVHV